MSYDYGPLRLFEITWRSGHVETVQGHSVLFDSNVIFGGGQPDPSAVRFKVYGMFGENWRLVLTGLEADMLSIRDATEREQLPG